MKLDWRILGLSLGASLLVAVSLLILHAPHTLSLFLLAVCTLIVPLLFWQEHQPPALDAQTRECIQRITKVACHDEVGKPVIVGANFDVTLWRQTERAHRDSLAHLQSLANMLPTPLCVINGSHNGQPRVGLSNPAFAALQTDSAELLSTALNPDAEPVFTLPTPLQGQPRRFKLQISAAEDSALCILIEIPEAAA